MTSLFSRRAPVESRDNSETPNHEMERQITQKKAKNKNKKSGKKKKAQRRHSTAATEADSYQNSLYANRHAAMEPLPKTKKQRRNSLFGRKKEDPYEGTYRTRNEEDHSNNRSYGCESVGLVMCCLWCVLLSSGTKKSTDCYNPKRR